MVEVVITEAVSGAEVVGASSLDAVSFPALFCTLVLFEPSDDDSDSFSGTCAGTVMGANAGIPGLKVVGGSTPNGTADLAESELDPTILC